MTTRFVGPGGSDANSGLTWALRKLTIDGCENTPVTAGDIIHVAPGVYRELLTIDVSGTAGNAIEYRADTSGALTDGIGGIVRITGSDDDIVATRANCITSTTKDYRTFTGFTFDMTTSFLISLLSGSSNWIVQDCHFAGLAANVSQLNSNGTGTAITVRRCVFNGARSSAIFFTHSVTVSGAGHVIENCIIVGAIVAGVGSTRVGGITVTNCTMISCVSGVRVVTALAVGQTITVNNCIFAWCATAALNGTVSGEIIENYNALWGNGSDRTNTATGANSNVYPPIFNPQVLLSGFRLLQFPLFGLSEWSPIRRITGTGTAADDLNGVTRPATAAKLSWGALQFADVVRETTTIHTGAVSLKLADAGIHQTPAPVGNASMTISVQVRWEADYAGTKPQLIIKQSGQSDITVTATGASDTWELLTNTFTPASSPDFVQVELRSNNTAVAGSYDVFWDQLEATLPPGSFESWITSRIPFGVVVPAGGGLPILGGAIVR